MFAEANVAIRSRLTVQIREISLRLMPLVNAARPREWSK